MRVNRILAQSRRNPSDFRIPFALKAMGDRKRVWFQVESGAAKGLWLKVYPDSEGGYICGVPERNVPELLSEHLKEGDCFWDVGAHVGFYSLVAARLVGKSGTVVALEPDQENFAALRENCQRNGSLSIQTLPMAVWSQSCDVRFQRGTDLSRMTGAVVTYNAGSDFVCQAITLDSLLIPGNPPRLVKIDVEGGELEVLKGATQTLCVSRPFLLVEIHHEHEIAEIVDFVVSRNYRSRFLSSNPGKILACFEPEGVL